MVSGSLIPPEYLLGTLYGRTATELGMPNRRREELIVAAMFASLYNNECGTGFQLPRRYLEGVDADGIDVTVEGDGGAAKLRLQIKGINIAQAIARRRAGIERATEAVLGDAAVRRRSSAGSTSADL